MFIPFARISCLPLFAAVLVGTVCGAEPAAERFPAGKWVSLFDGKTLAGWTASDFATAGDVTVKDGQIRLASGQDLTGITATMPVPKVNYEVRLEATRVDGADFFCGLTVPVRDAHCTLVVGGWGGGVVGISSINGYDASENATTKYREFKTGQPYKIRLRVTAERLTAWIDDQQMVDVNLRDAELDTRIEVTASKPFGIASWQTTSALKNLELRRLTVAEVKTVNAGTPAD